MNVLKGITYSTLNLFLVLSHSIEGADMSDRGSVEPTEFVQDGSLKEEKNTDKEAYGNIIFRKGNYLLDQDEQLISEYKFLDDETKKYIYVSEYRFKMKCDGPATIKFFSKKNSAFKKLLDMKEKCPECSHVAVVYKVPDIDYTSAQIPGRYLFRVKTVNITWNLENNWLHLLHSYRNNGFRFENVTDVAYRQFLESLDGSPSVIGGWMGVSKITKTKMKSLDIQIENNDVQPNEQDDNWKKLYQDLKNQSEKRLLKFNTERNIKYNIIMNGF